MNAIFTNSSGSSYTWAQALTNNNVQAYLAYYDNPATDSESGFNYLSTISDMDDTTFRQNKGYWIYANSSWNLTIPSVGGSLSNETYAYSRLRFSNGTSEVNITQAGLGGYSWIEDTIKYWGMSMEDYDKRFHY